MAADPIPMPEDSTEVTINPDNTIDGQVEVNNGGMIKFEVSRYPAIPNTDPVEYYNTCTVTIEPGDISWSVSPAAGQNTIKVGN
jgi:hypothetical protein